LNPVACCIYPYYTITPKRGKSKKVSFLRYIRPFLGDANFVGDNPEIDLVKPLLQDF